MDSLPMDIIFSCILPKLPAKSLLRFKCVSKSFLAEISSPKFIKLHHLNALSSDANRLLVLPGDDDTLRMYDLDSLHSPPLVCHYPEPITFSSFIVAIVASCECYFVIGCGYTQLDGLILLNLSTHTYLELPRVVTPLTSKGVLYGMCHCLDEINDDYKVVRFLEFSDAEDDVIREVRVCSLRTNSWKLVESTRTVETIASWCDGTILIQNYLLHLIFFDARVGLGHMTRIGCFDMKAEQWADDVLLPDTFLGGIGSNLHQGRPFYLGLLDDQLCLLSGDMNESSYDLWVMMDYRVKESWEKLMSIPLSQDQLSTRLWQRVYRPLAYRKDSPHQLLCRRDSTGGLFWYNLKRKKAIEAELVGVGDSSFSLGYVFKGSLMNFPGAQPIRASSDKSRICCL